MKIAITADVHLTNREKHPERFNALSNILDQLVEQCIEIFIIAGDLFDASCTTPGDLEVLLRKPHYSGITTFIIPGNHDLVISEGAFTLSNINYITKPQMLNLADNTQVVFIPYGSGASVGEVLAENQFKVNPDSWILIGHGDWLTGIPLRNTYEDGMYMPLSSRDIQIYRPRKVFLGHIHAKTDSTIVHYPGSPCGVDVTETGIRSYIIYDTASGKFERREVDTDVIYFNELITIIPMTDEGLYINKIIKRTIDAWNLTASQKKKARIRLILQGYSTNRGDLTRVITESLEQANCKLYEQPDVSKVKSSNDTMRAEIAESVQEKILDMDFNHHMDEPIQDDYILAAMNIIYGGK